MVQNCESVREYIEAFRQNPLDWGIIPLNAAADVLQVARSSVERMVKDGRLTLITVHGVKAIRMKDILGILDARQEECQTVVAVLEKVARQHKPPVFYEAVMNPLGLNHEWSAHRAKIGGLLGDASRGSHERDGILLSVLVHNKEQKAGATLPSEGFFEMAADVGYRWKDKHAFVQREMQRVYQHYARR